LLKSVEANGIGNALPGREEFKIAITRLDKTGRIYLPKKLVRELNLKPNDMILFRKTGGKVPTGSIVVAKLEEKLKE